MHRIGRAVQSFVLHYRPRAGREGLLGVLALVALAAVVLVAALMAAARGPADVRSITDVPVAEPAPTPPALPTPSEAMTMTVLAAGSGPGPAEPVPLPAGPPVPRALRLAQPGGTLAEATVPRPTPALSASSDRQPSMAPLFILMGGLVLLIAAAVLVLPGLLLVIVRPDFPLAPA
jgi:hypothetical protein